MIFCLCFPIIWWIKKEARKSIISYPGIFIAPFENMVKIKQAGGIVCPPVMAYYYKPESVDEVTDFFVGKILDVLGIEHGLYPRWGGRQRGAGS